MILRVMYFRIESFICGLNVIVYLSPYGYPKPV
jgi:hypothetical protein